MNSISASHLRKSFGSTVAIDDVNLSIVAGDIYGLVGSDGAGKTTTLRLLVGALKADTGEVSICGNNLNHRAEQARASLGYLPQRFSFYEDLTVLENIRFFAELRGIDRNDWLPRCMEILNFVGLAEFKDRRAGQLSGGMKQKLGLASALVSRPKVLLLDEPTTGVDPVTRQDFWQLLIRLSASHLVDGGSQEAQRVSVLLTTPYMDEASRCHRVGFMRLGRIIAEGTPSELRSNLEGRILELRCPSPLEVREVARKLDGVEDVRLFGDRLHLRIQAGSAEKVTSTLEDAFPAHNGPNLEVRLIPPTLEDVFISLAG
jgi:ABC-2 type transport system ATP-binding protein